MELLYQRCAGLDVHKETVVAAVRLAVDGKVVTEVKTFATTTQCLLSLSDWLAENGCTHVAMEATGVYWKPVWHVLEDGEVELVLANASHVKNVPGRKTDVNDATWLAELLAHGLIRASFVPDGQTQELRALLRTRKQLVREKTRHTQRIHKTLEDANIKLDAVLATIDQEVEGNLAPFRTAVELVSTVPGVSTLSAQVIVSEVGTDMSRFPTAGHLLSWAGLCPRNDESAGKRRSTRLRKGAAWLKTVLVQCAWAASRKKASYLQAQFLRLKARRGPQKAVCAVAASILKAVYHMLKNGTLYHDLGPDHFHRRSKTTQTQRLVRRLEHLGYSVEIKPLTTAA